MNYKILHYDKPEIIPNDIKLKMLDAVCDVYDTETAKEFEWELIEKLPYEHTVILDESTGQVIGLGCLMKSGLDFDIWEFAWALVREKYRGMGIGKLLNDERIKIVKQKYGQKVLCVTKKMWHLERNGFRVICTFSDGDNLMACEL
ncbi:MAG: GNAT family N-acetyltransferase [Rickettsiales bacterium]|nr:GNAT family N-acetyltransferase [Rickettsiales bacterium]